jgi:hypothetical protein
MQGGANIEAKIKEIKVAFSHFLFSYCPRGILQLCFTAF